ncbi:hypothetical protein PACTADRAFT_50786 [Pachysolen tannophilus NRRL Y-2460]|uniref:Transcription elongation factor Spt6 n=1 Tax=Pachysolen tannophilus NRRL Y-2460 TaxID=669874 RepID=A0A1E4TT69_PACTA|nr:hypothetical protein PACTADRAFT_50786 [Pachysolen tannophilus NRRL Y-2460]
MSNEISGDEREIKDDFSDVEDEGYKDKRNDNKHLDDEALDEDDDDGLTDSSEEDDDEDEDEDEIKKVSEGFIVDDDDDEEEINRKRKKHRRKKRKEAEARRRKELEDIDKLDEDDLELLLENSGAKPVGAKSKPKIRRLVKAGLEGNDQEGENELANLHDGSDADREAAEEAHRRGLTDMFSDVEEDVAEGDEVGFAPRTAFNDEFDDFIEEDEFSDEEGQTERRTTNRVPQINNQMISQHVSAIDKEKLDELYEILGDGEDYEWALEGEEETGDFNEDNEQQPTELADVFEPSELKERMLTAEDNIVRVTDVPERYQELRKNIKKYQLDDEEFNQEKEWVAEEMIKFKSDLINSNPAILEPFKNSVGYVLGLIVKENCEVPFIWNHRRDYLLHTLRRPDGTLSVQKLLQEDELWRIVQLDIDFHNFNDTKISIAKTFEPLNVYDGTYQDQIANAKSMIELQDLNEYINFVYSTELKDKSLTITAPEDDDSELTTTSKGKKKKHSRYAIYEKIRADGIFHVIRSIGIKASEFVENLVTQSKFYTTEDADLSPEDMAKEVIEKADSLFGTVDQAVEGVKNYFAEQLFTNPKFRSEVRSNYEKYAKVDIVLTEKGRLKIDSSGPYADFKYLINYPITSFISKPDLFLRMLEAESMGYVVIKINFDLQSYTNHAFNTYLKSDYSSDIASSWNKLRYDALNIAIKKLVPLVSLNIKENIRRDCETKIYFEIRKNFAKKIDQAPYQPKGFEKGTIPRVLSVSFRNGTRSDAVISAMLDDEGKLIDLVKFEEYVKDDEFDATFIKLVQKNKPDVIAVSGCNVSTATILYSKLSKIVENTKLTVNDDDDLEFETGQPPLLELLWVNNETARLYENSKRGANDYPGKSSLAKFVIGIAKYVQQPLLEYIALGENLPSLSIHKFQSLISPEKLKDAVTTSLVDIVNMVGVDINEAVRDEYLALELPYISGLGPRKASGIIQSIQNKGSTLNNRSDLITQQITSKYVFLNCASFLKIPYNNRTITSSDTDPLDATRIHPQDYELAIKMASDALELDEEDIADINENGGSIINQLLSDGVDKLNELVLEDYGNELEAKFHLKKRATLQMIKEELQHHYEELRRSFHKLTEAEIFHMLTGETKETFNVGTILPINLRRVDNRFMIGLTQFEVDCKINGDKIDYSNGREYNIGQTVQGVVTRCDYYQFKCEVSLLKQDIQLYSEQPKPYKIDDLWDFKAEYEDIQLEKERENSERRSTQILQHPLFHNFNSRQAEEYLAPRMIGECVIRPSSLGENHFTITLKIANQLFQHIVVVQVRNQLNNTTSYRIDKETFEDMDEVVAKYVEELTASIDAMVSHEKFRKNPLEEVKDWLNKYSEANQNRSCYTFCYNRKAPGWFYLLFKTSVNSPITTWNVKALPNGYLLSGNVYPDMTSLCNGFKQIMINKVNEKKMMRQQGRVPVAVPRGGYTSNYGGYAGSAGYTNYGGY